MKKGFRYILLAFSAIVVAAVASCKKDNSQSIPNEEIAYFPLGDDLKVHPLGDQFFASFTSEEDWKVDAPDCDWLSVIPSSGSKGTTKLTIIVNPYYDQNNESSRDCSLNFKSGSQVIRMVKVSQSAAFLRIREDMDMQYSFGWRKGQSIDYNIETNISYRVVLDDSTRFIKTERENSFRLETNDYNFGIEDYIAELRVVPVSNENVDLSEAYKETITQTHTLTQDHLIFIVAAGSDVSLEELSADEMTGGIILNGFSELGDKFVQEKLVDEDKKNHMTKEKFMVISEAGVKCSVDSQDGLLRLYLIQKDTLENRQVIIQKYEATLSEPNPSFESKEFNIPVTISGLESEKGAQRSITLIQKPYVFNEVNNQNSIDFVNAGDTVQVTLNTTGPWKLDKSDNSDWLKVTRSDGKSDFQGIGRISFDLMASQNYDFDDLKAVLTMSAEGLNDDIEINLQVSQNRFAFDVDPDENLYRMSRLDLLEKKLKVNSSGKWEITMTDGQEDVNNWLEIDGLSLSNGKKTLDAGNYEYKVRAVEENPSDANRKKTLKFVSLYHQQNNQGQWNEKQYIKSFDVIQERLVCRVDKSSSDTATFVPTQYPAYKASGNTQSLRVRCSAPWKIESKPDWLTFYDEKNPSDTIHAGDGLAYVTLLMEADTHTGTSNDRSGEVVFSADTDGDGYADRNMKFNVSQDMFVFNTTVASSYSFAALNEDLYEFSVEATNDVGLNIDFPKWANLTQIKTEKFEKTTSYEYSIKPGYVTSVNNPRDSTATVGNSLDVNSVGVSLSQKGYVFEVSTETLTQFAELDPTEQTFKVSCDGTYKIQSKPFWLDLSNSGGVYSAIAKKNTGDERSGNIIVALTDSRVPYTSYSISVSQRNFIFDVKPDTHKASALENLENSIFVYSSGGWSASSNKQFVTFIPSSGVGNRNGENCTLKVAANYTKETREASIKISSKVDSTIIETINVNQDSYKFSVSGGDHKFGAAETSSDKWTVACTGGAGAWEVSDDKSWITCKKEGNRLVVQVTSNEGDGKTATAEREGVVTIQTTDDSKSYFDPIKIKITQEGFTPSTSK